MRNDYGGRGGSKNFLDSASSLSFFFVCLSLHLAFCSPVELLHVALPRKHSLALQVVLHLQPSPQHPVRWKPLTSNWMGKEGRRETSVRLFVVQHLSRLLGHISGILTVSISEECCSLQASSSCTVASRGFAHWGLMFKHLNTPAYVDPKRPTKFYPQGKWRLVMVPLLYFLWTHWHVLTMAVNNSCALDWWNEEKEREKDTSIQTGRDEKSWKCHKTCQASLLLPLGIRFFSSTMAENSWKMWFQGPP